jgi:hypothetical protein
MSDQSPHAHDAPPPEPQTPMWLPALGVALFVGAAVWWATRPAPPPPPPVEAAASASASAAVDGGAAPAPPPGPQH